MIGPLVEFMVAQPGMVARLLERHGPDGSGSCRGCRQYDRTTPVYPCSIRIHAEAAEDLARARHTS